VQAGTYKAWGNRELREGRREQASSARELPRSKIEEKIKGEERDSHLERRALASA
jgi:hypothetical protein